MKYPHSVQAESRLSGYLRKSRMFALILLLLLTTAALGTSYFLSGPAQGQNKQISLNSPTSFPVDI